MLNFRCIRILLFLALMPCTSILMHGQDTLIKTNNIKQSVKILEVNEFKVKYKIIVDSLGLLYTINKDDVLKIIYESGVIDSFPGRVLTKSVPLYKVDPRSTDFGKNFISMNLVDLFGGKISLAYERLFNSGKKSVKGTLTWIDSDPYYKGYGLGLEYYFYPYGQGKVKYFAGPSFEFRNHIHKQENNNGFSQLTFLIQNGFLFQPTKNINGSVNVGFGYEQYSTKYANTIYRDGRFHNRVGVNIGYKF